MTTPAPIHLWFEGVDDRAFLDAILQHHGVATAGVGYRPDKDDKRRGGFDLLVKAVPVEVKSLSRVGFVIDADQPEDGRWLKLREALRAAGVIAPDEPASGGLVLDGVRPDTRVGVWVMPDNRSSGMLEDFVRELMRDREHDPIWQLAQRTTEEAGQLKAPFKARHRSKAELCTWRAWQDPPGLGLRHIASNPMVRFDAPLAVEFVRWFERLVAPPSTDAG